jgi:acyl-CoA synthetase (AMP-forming)/AMP-acid ligase II
MQTFIHPIRRAERIARDRLALVCGDTRMAFGEFTDRLRKLHSVVNGLAPTPGDRVAILAFNSIAFVELYCGISASGRVQVPLNFRWAQPELAYALADSGARVLFTDRDPGALAELVDRVIRIDLGEYETLLAEAEQTPFDEQSVHENDLAGLFYTGGTTGESKGVMLTHRNLIANAIHAQMCNPHNDGDVDLVMAPLFHAAGSISVLQDIYAGVPQVIVPAFDPGVVLDLFAREGVTVTLGVPTMVAAVVEEQIARPRAIPRFRNFAHGGSPIALEVIRRGRTAFPGVEFTHMYGATETAPLATGLRNEEQQLGTPNEKSCGKAVIGVEVVIRDVDGNPVADGEAGEVTMRGNNIMAGYWNKPEQTEAALREGWYWSGDLGRMDADGYLYLLDRSKDMIISGGENVYCTEVEDALYSHPAVLEATVFGIPDARWGEVVHAVVVPRAEVTAEALIAHCKQLIAGYKVPRSISFQTDPLPKSGPGKVLKRELRAPYWLDQDTAIA